MAERPASAQEETITQTDEPHRRVNRRQRSHTVQGLSENISSETEKDGSSGQDEDEIVSFSGILGDAVPRDCDNRNRRCI